MNADQLVERAKHEPESILQLWMLDGRRFVRMVAQRELQARAASGEGDRGSR